jgi:uncharacterized protein Yka (UPF0111/DUF47 family)
MGNGQSKRLKLFGTIFDPPTDFYSLLETQAEKTIEGMKALVDWLHHEDSAERCQTVRDLEAEADQIKFGIAKKLFESFITPFDREDIYDLSQRLDEVINGAKAIAREIEAFETKPSLHPEIIDMANMLVDGTLCLRLSFGALRSNHEEAQKQAILACKSFNRLSKIYRRSMQELFHGADIKTILRVKEVYKAMLNCGEKIDTVGERLLHAVVKLA